MRNPENQIGDASSRGAAIVLSLAAADLLFHLLIANRYGIIRDEPRYWLWFGVLVGVGMENKYSTAFFAFAVAGAVLLTAERRFLSTKWLWLGALGSLLIFVPNLIWLVRHNFPFFELMHNI